ncbi:CRISPR-associated protein, Csd1-type [Actinomadura rubteroloni]|uniref:CRISPR-associated protein, Csd1-type n=1 Tax=Actinomadura rubteroloni TaxID=1926885 RepID=A0A2P4URW9_9ACTN|nr:type I-C CRISPR-associated protein Cas8c/Csd1 [Actinomadura rubteroloni]POM27786.1 CRISPR-associated protein, Csd1-type [Actinomadura rubteroloni]
MLLKHLADHAEQRPKLPPDYYRVRSVKWALQLDGDGNPMAQGLASLATDDNPAGFPMPAPYVYRSGMKPPPALLVDTLQYVFAMPKDDSLGEEEEANRRNDAYVALLRRWRDSAPDDPRAAAVVSFFDRARHLNITLPEDAKHSDTVAILLSGDREYVHMRESAVECWRAVVRERKSTGNAKGVCLSCGQIGELLDTIPEPIKGGAIPSSNGRTRDAQLVSINKPAQGRGGTIQLGNTPICDRCGRAMAVLNSLLADPEHRFRGSDTVTVWWLRDEQELPLGSALDRADPADVDAVYKAVDKANEDIDTAVDNVFYAVTLGANQGRAVIRDWIDVPLTEALQHVTVWFDDHRLPDPWKGRERVLPLWQIAQSCGRWDSDKKRYVDKSAPDATYSALLRSALTGVPVPVWVLPHLLHRVRADSRIDLPRVALVQLVLSRPPFKETRVSNEENVAVIWGRAFAVLESIQRRAIPDVNTTIGDRYLSTAMTRPQATLTRLFPLANGHLKKLKNSKQQSSRAAGFALEVKLKALLEQLPDGGPPERFELRDQAAFIIGYSRQGSEDITRARAAANSAD